MSEEWKHAKWVSIVGMLAWIFGILSGVGAIISGLVSALTYAAYPVGFGYGALMAIPIFNIISGVIAILISLIIVLPKFSMKCSKKDWDFLLNWVLNIGSLRFPWMLVWGFLVGLFGWGWGGIFILVPSFVLIFAGPEKYEWKSL